MTVRAATPLDAPAIAAIYRPHVTSGHATFETEPAPDEIDMLARMAASDGLYPWLVDTGPGGRVQGYAHAAAFHVREAYRWTVETSVYVADRDQRSGVGRRLYAALIDTLAAQGFAQAIARIALPAPGSEALHRSLGFRPVGAVEAVGWKGGRWIDVAIWQRALATPGAEPAEPVRFADLAL